MADRRYPAERIRLSNSEGESPLRTMHTSLNSNMMHFMAPLASSLAQPRNTNSSEPSTSTLRKSIFSMELDLAYESSVVTGKSTYSPVDASGTRGMPRPVNNSRPGLQDRRRMVPISAPTAQ